MAKKKIDQSNLSADEILYLKAKDAYYSGEPLMSDENFDLLEDKLRSEDSFLIDLVGHFKKGPKLDIAHKWPMLSLDKAKFKKNYIPYDEAKRKLFDLANGLIIYEPKLDGNAISVQYENGQLISIASRGNGQMGQDYTQKLKSKVPNKIKDFSGEVRGEAVIDVELFNQKYAQSEDKAYKNPRNFVAGILNSDIDKGIVEKLKDIDFIAFDIKGLEVDDTKKWLISKGFETLDFSLESQSNLGIDEFCGIYERFSKYRERSKYQLDGYVAKFRDYSIREKLAENGHHPNWALALKFISQEVSTQIIGIEFNMSKRGELAPVALLEPVDLMGSTVQRASLYNVSWMIANKCFIGAQVTLTKSGDIIPVITSVLKESQIEWEMPKEWNGYCLDYDGVNLLVKDYQNTPEWQSIKMASAISALGFKGIGPATAELLSGLTIQQLMSQNPEGLRMLLLNTGHFKDGRELELIIESFFNLTQVHMWQVIYSFGWRNCGKTISKELAKWMVGSHFSFKGLEKNVVESFINDQSKVEEVNKLISIMENNNIKVIRPNGMQEGTITFEMTGNVSAPGFGTKEVYAIECAKYGAIHMSLKQGTDFLVTDSIGSSSGKMKKAEKLGVKIMTYPDFLDYLQNLNVN